MVLTGRMMDAAEAERSGLVSRIVPAASLIEEALKVAALIASLSAAAVYAAKESVNRAYETTLWGRHPLRAPHLPLAVRHRGPEGRHEGLRRKTPRGVQEPVNAKGSIGGRASRSPRIQTLRGRQPPACVRLSGRPQRLSQAGAYAGKGELSFDTRYPANPRLAKPSVSTPSSKLWDGGGGRRDRQRSEVEAEGDEADGPSSPSP